jgi:hypothetical protein
MLDELTIEEISDAMQGDLMLFEVVRFLIINELGHDKFKELYREAFTRIIQSG